MIEKVKTKLVPCSDRVLVKCSKPQNTKYDGILVPKSSQKKQEIGKIIAMGPGKKDSKGNLIKIDFAVGQEVMWDKYGGQEITVGDEEFVMIKSDDIIAILK